MLSHVVEWNSPVAGPRYAELYDGDLVQRLHPASRKDAAPSEPA